MHLLLLRQTFILDCSCSSSSMRKITNCHSHMRTCYLRSEKSMSRFSSRNWCFRKGGRLINKSDIDQYVPPVNITSRKFYWVGLRKTDWVIDHTLPSIFSYIIRWILKFIHYHIHIISDY